MNFIKRLCALVFMLIAFTAGIFTIFAALELVSVDTLTDMLSVVSSSSQLQIVVVLAGLILAVVGVMTPFRVEKNVKKNKVITFQNTDGGVAISTLAVEEYIKKIAKFVPGIKAISSRVNVDKKGINVVSSVTMSAGANIPETTEHLQGEIRTRIQRMLGQEEHINITVHISRIVPGKGRDDEMVPENDEDMSPVPFGE